MSNQHMLHLFLTLAVLPSLLVLSGCLSFDSGQLPERTAADISRSEAKVDVGLDVKWYSLGALHPRAADLFRATFQKAMMQSGLFSGIVSGDEKPLYFDVKFQNEGNLTSGTIMAILCGLTLTVLPAYARDDFILTVRVKRGGTVLKEYRYEDRMSTWIELFLVLGMPFNDGPEKVGNALRENMVWNFLHDVQKDGILNGS